MKHRLFLLLPLALISACQAPISPKSREEISFSPPGLESKLPALKVFREGPAVEIPPQLSDESYLTLVPIPPGTKIETGNVSFTSEAPTQLRVISRKTSATGSKSFAPPDPPSPVSLARGKLFFWGRIVGGILTVLGVLAITVAKFPRAGIALIGSGIGFAFISTPWGLGLTVAGIVAAGVFWYAHHVKESEFAAKQDTIEKLRQQS